ncbi:MAG: hypothetical protein HY744_05350 [Deltaproteobacteria bacterium]|nr:hypothetical protein [Deltaproteobacteria bacterium]
MSALAVVAAAGARTPLGLTAAQTGFLLRAGMAAMAAAPLCDAEGGAVTMCFDTTLAPLCVGEERACALALAALGEALAAVPEAGRPRSALLLLCLDGAGGGGAGGGGRRRGGAAPGAAVAAAVHASAEQRLGAVELEVVARGAAGAAWALGPALARLAARQIDAVLLGGVHTDYDPLAIRALEAQGRLFSPKNPDAVVPGEAAAFALLARPERARLRDGGSTACLVAVGTGEERAGPDNDHSSFEARGLTAAVRGAAAAIEPAQGRIGWAITDLAFEQARHHEWSAVLTRTHALWCEPHALDAPAQRLGRLGAAALPLGLVLAAEGWRRGWAPAPRALAIAGSDTGERGALLLEAQEG